MKISGIIANKSIEILSGLANNSDSIIPMTVKDTLSNGLIVKTYKDKGGKHDALERGIEEFGTGAIWLFGIPTVKKIIDKTVYPALKLNPNLDIRILKDKATINNIIQHANQALSNNPNNIINKDMVKMLDDLNNQNSVFKAITNKNLYKGMFIAKFLISTILSAFALSKLIKYKQKSTQKRIEYEVKSNLQSKNAVSKNVQNSNVYNIFKGSENKSDNISFTGGLKSLANVIKPFIYNPIANTSILDCVITATRLNEARNGERKEVALKEAFQIIFIYAIAKPTQLLFEKIGNKVKLPIALDPKVLFSKNIKEELSQAKEIIKNEGLKDLSKKELTDKIYKLASNNIKNPLLQLLNKNGDISIIKSSGFEALDYLKGLDEKSIKSTIDNILKAEENIQNLKGIKAYKIFAVLANIALGAFAMGVVQPLLNIAMRKLLNNGDNRNPAIVAQEKEIQFKAEQNI